MCAYACKINSQSSFIHNFKWSHTFKLPQPPHTRTAMSANYGKAKTPLSLNKHTHTEHVPLHHVFLVSDYCLLHDASKTRKYHAHIVYVSRDFVCRYRRRCACVFYHDFFLGQGPPGDVGPKGIRGPKGPPGQMVRLNIQIHKL